MLFNRMSSARVLALLLEELDVAPSSVGATREDRKRFGACSRPRGLGTYQCWANWYWSIPIPIDWYRIDSNQNINTNTDQFGLVFNNTNQFDRLVLANTDTNQFWLMLVKNNTDQPIGIDEYQSVSIGTLLEISVWEKWVEMAADQDSNWWIPIQINSSFHFHLNALLFS